MGRKCVRHGYQRCAPRFSPALTCCMSAKLWSCLHSSSLCMGSIDVPFFCECAMIPTLVRACCVDACGRAGMWVCIISVFADLLDCFVADLQSLRQPSLDRRIQREMRQARGLSKLLPRLVWIPKLLCKPCGGLRCIWDQGTKHERASTKIHVHEF